MKPITSGNPALALGLALVSVPVLLAQAPAPAPADQQDTDTEIVVLSPFMVNTETDSGYVAVDSLAGGRLSTPVRVTPASISSMTKEFINDLAITNVQDALSWGLNIVPTDFRNGLNGGSGGSVFNYWSVSIRGDSHVQGGNPPTKNYFPTFMAIDTYNVDRIEVNGGPNSILFGIGDIGGALTSYTKNAVFQNEFTDLTTQFSSFGGYRGTVDMNTELTDRWALRVNAVAANEKGWRDGDFNKKYGVTLASTFKLSNDTQLRFELEGWKHEKAIYASAIRDGISLWDGTTTSPTWGAVVPGVNDNPLEVPGAPGIDTMEAWGGPANYLVWTPSVGLLNWAGGLRSMGTRDIGQAAFLRPESYTYGPTGTEIPALPDREFTIVPTDATLKQDAMNATVSFEHRINPNSELQIAGYFYEDKAQAINYEGAGGGLDYGIAVDLNQQLPNGQPNPNFGERYSDYFLNEQMQNHKAYEFRGQYSYHFDTEISGIPVNQAFSVSAGHQVTELGTRQHQLGYLNNFPNNWTPGNWTQSMIWGRVYWDQPHAALRVPKEVNGSPVEYVGLPFNWFDWDSKQKINYVGAFSQTRMWEDRLNISLGIRNDSYDNTKLDARGTNNTEASDSGTTYSAGFVGYVTPWLGIVGNISENFQPAAGGQAPSVYGEVFGPSFGKGQSIGVRVSTNDNKYWASANYYNDTAHDVIGADDVGFQGIWNNYFDAGGTNTDIGPAGNVTGSPGNYNANMQYNDVYDVEYKGWEFELTANPTKNIRLQARYALPEGTKENNGPNNLQYFNEKLPIWQQAASGTSAESVILADALETAQERLVAIQVPTVTGRLAKKIYNFFGTYSFLEGSLQGFEIGGGITGLGKQYGNPWDQVFGERTLSPAYNTVSLMLSYSKTMQLMDREVRARFQINVDNLLDEDDLIFTSFQGYGTDQLESMDFRYLQPREITFTARFSF